MDRSVNVVALTATTAVVRLGHLAIEPTQVIEVLECKLAFEHLDRPVGAEKNRPESLLRLAERCVHELLELPELP